MIQKEGRIRPGTVSTHEIEKRKERRDEKWGNLQGARGGEPKKISGIRRETVRFGDGDRCYDVDGFMAMGSN